MTGIDYREYYIHNTGGGRDGCAAGNLAGRDLATSQQISPANSHARSALAISAPGPAVDAGT